MADLPISLLPVASTVSTTSPLAVDVSGITSQATVNTILTAFSSNSAKSSLVLSDELMIYDGTLLKATVESILTTYITTSAPLVVNSSDQIMIYNGDLVKTTVNDILQSFVDYTLKTTLDISDQLMIYDGSMLKTTVNEILLSFLQAPTATSANITDQLMIFDSILYNVEISSVLSSFVQYSNKSGLSGDEEVMIYDPLTSSMLKTTISEIIGSVISPIRYVYYPVETNATNVDDYRIRIVGDSGTFQFNIAFPSDLTSLISVYLISSAGNFTNPSANITAESHFASADSGEATLENNGSDSFVFDFVEDNFVKLDITSLFTTDGGASRDAQAGDMGVAIMTNVSVGGNLNYYMIELIYEGPGGSGSTVLVIDNLTSTSTTDALSANQGRVLDISKQDISTLQTDIEAIGFSSLTVTDDPVSDTDVSNKAYVDANSGSVTVINNLLSTSPTDALSANQGNVLDTIKQNISTLQSDIESINFNTLTAIDVPSASTDVANKAYVDANSGAIVVVDDLTSTSATDALSANQGRVLNVSKQNISTLQSTVAGFSFSTLTVTGVPSSSTDVANKDYVDSSSGGITVIDNLTSTSSTDALSANQGRVLDEGKQDISTLQDDIEALTFTSLTVSDAPTSGTDVTNKDYVDGISFSKTLWLPVANPQDLTSGSPPYPIPPVERLVDPTSSVRISWTVPDDYTAIDNANIYYTRPNTTTMGATSTISLSFVGGGEDEQANSITNNSPSNIDLDTSGAVNNIKIQDVSSLFDDFSSGDLVTFMIIHITGTADIDIIGINLTYV